MKYLLYINIVLLLFACQNGDTSKLKNHQKPVGISKINEIVVIADQDLWEGATGDTLRYYFAGPYPIMPRPEPMFDLRHYTPLELKEGPLRKTLRTYLIVADLSDKDSETTQMVKKDIGEERFNASLKGEPINTLAGQNKWAQKQLVTYVFGNSKSKVQETLRKQFPNLAKKVRLHDKVALEGKTYALGSASNAKRRKINDDFGVDLSLPSDYKEVIYKPEEGVAWYRRDGKKGIQNIAIQKFKYTSEDQLSNENMTKVFDEFGKAYVETSTEGSHLKINSEDLPIITYDINQGSLIREYRGVWEMTKDFSGGPFFSYAYVQGDEIVFVTGFVLAIGTDKRDMMQQLDFLMKKNYVKE